MKFIEIVESTCNLIDNIVEVSIEASYLEDKTKISKKYDNRNKGDSI